MTSTLQFIICQSVISTIESGEFKIFQNQLPAINDLEKDRNDDSDDDDTIEENLFGKLIISCRKKIYSFFLRVTKSFKNQFFIKHLLFFC